MKVSFIGSGAVACGTAFATGIRCNINEIVLLDINEDWAKGKAIDLRQGFILNKKEIRIKGTSNYNDIKGSDAIVITASISAVAGVSNREALMTKNKEIIEDIAKKLKNVISIDTKQPLIIVVTNPLDIVLNHFIKVGGFNKKKTVGSGNLLDGGRLQDFLAREFNIEPTKITTYAVAQHGVKIVYLLSKTIIDGKPLFEYIKEKNISKERIEEICKNAVSGAQEIIGLLQRERTVFGPAISIVNILDSYINDKKEEITLSIYCNGEYGVKDYCLGCPVIIGKNGIEEIKVYNISEEEEENFKNSLDFVLEFDK
jgi:malate dehydrogenase